MKRTLLSLLLVAISLPVMAEKPVEYFDAGNPIEYCGEKFYFAWSSRPYDIYVIQEYLPKGEKFENYTQMFTVSVLFYGDAPFSAINAVQAKTAELDERKKTDKVCNYIVAENNGEYIVDFIVSESSGDSLSCVEADIHYYKDIVIDGKKASLLYFYSRRAYGDDIMPFMQSIPDLRTGWYNGMSNLNIMPKFRK